RAPAMRQRPRGLATALINTADMAAFRMSLASHIETTEFQACGHGPGCARLVPYLGGSLAVSTRPRWAGSLGHYARTHDRGAVIVAGRARHPGDAQRAARAWLRHRPAHRARRGAGPDLAHSPSGRLPVARPAPGRRADHPRRRRI